jgi:hypothetical protein
MTGDLEDLRVTGVLDRVVGGEFADGGRGDGAAVIVSASGSGWPGGSCVVGGAGGVDAGQVLAAPL